MYNCLLLRTIFPILGLVIALTPAGNAVVSSRIASVNTEARTPLQHTVSPRAKDSIDLGAAPASLKLEGLKIRFNMTGAQQAALNQLLSDQQNPSSPRYQQWLTPQQFGAQFGLSAEDISKVSSWLTTQGFTVTDVANSSTFITFSGTAAQVQQAFGTTIHSLSRNGEKHIANLTEPILPSAIASVVSNITGLNDFKLKPHIHTRQVPLNAVHPQNTISTTNGIEHFIAPGDFYTIYNLNPLLSNSTNGAGITIAVMGQVDITPNITPDVAAFRTASGLSPSNLPTLKLYGTNPGSPTPACLNNPPPNLTCIPSVSDLNESLLDVEWAGAAAPSANIVFVYSENVIDTSLVQAIDNNIAPIMTVSYGACEHAFGQADLNSFNQTFQMANAQGITIFGPSGDNGATDCDSNVSSATQGLAVDYPASSPYVTSVGGTMFNEGTGNYWNATNGANGGSALSYIPEAVWNETASDLANGAGGFSATGGGASAYFAKPVWQTGTGVPNDFSRDVPDVSLNAASQHDGYLLCAQNSCSNGTFISAQSTFTVIGGTSVSTPTFAGIVALLEQKLGSHGLGNINPNIYALANSATYNSIFHDVIATGNTAAAPGNNNSPCTAGTKDCPNGGSIGYTAGTGYDQATGWGSVDASVLINTWATFSFPPVPIGGTATSLTTVTANPTSATAGTAISLAISVAAGTTSPTLPTPTGTVQVLVDGTPVPSSSTALSAGAATYSLATTNLASGAHVLSAVYSGDANFNSSKGTTNINITSATVADFTLTPATASTTAKSGSTATGVVFTLAPVNGFTGSINLTASTDQPLTAGFAFSIEPVVITSTTPATGVATTFTLSAYQNNARGTTTLKQASNHPPTGTAPWYIAGSGATLACMFLLVLPRRRRWGALLAVIVSVGVIGAAGCGSGGSSSTPTNPTVINSTPGTYNITVTATATTGAGTLTHHATVTFIVQ